MKIFKWREFIELIIIVDVKFFEFCSFLNFDIRIVELKKFKEFFVEVGSVYFGLFLFGGRFLILSYSVISVFMVYDKNWKCIEKIVGLYYVFSVY